MAEITLEFLGEQILRLREEMRAFHGEMRSVRDDITVLTGIAIRLEGAVQGLTVELRGMRSQQARGEREVGSLAGRVDSLEERVERLESRLLT